MAKLLPRTCARSWRGASSDTWARRGERQSSDYEGFCQNSAPAYRVRAEVFRRYILACAPEQGFCASSALSRVGCQPRLGSSPSSETLPTLALRSFALGSRQSTLAPLTAEGGWLSSWRAVSTRL